MGRARGVTWGALLLMVCGMAHGEQSEDYRQALCQDKAQELGLLVQSFVDCGYSWKNPDLHFMVEQCQSLVSEDILTKRMRLGALFFEKAMREQGKQAACEFALEDVGSQYIQKVPAVTKKHGRK